MSAIGEPHPQYSPAKRAEVVKTAQEKGISAAAREHGVDKKSASNWLVEAGIDPSTVASKVLSNQQKATQHAVASRQKKAAEQKERIVEMLGIVAELGLTKEIEFLQGERKVTKRIDANGNEVGFENVRLSEVVGSRTRAIHDLQLLTDNPTERAGGLLRPSHEQMAQLRDELASRRAAAEQGPQGPGVETA